MYARAVTMSLLLACSPEPKPLAVWAGDCKLYDLPNTVAEQVCAGSERFFHVAVANPGSRNHRGRREMRWIVEALHARGEAVGG